METTHCPDLPYPLPLLCELHLSQDLQREVVLAVLQAHAKCPRRRNIDIHNQVWLLWKILRNRVSNTTYE
jgi:hypothetical protein